MNDSASPDRGSTRQRLVEAARRQVRERGFEGATSRAITSAAGANLAAITYHFGSKEALLGEVVTDAVRRGVAPALEILSRDDLAPEQRVLEAVTALRTAFTVQADDAQLLVEALVRSRRIPIVHEAVVELLRDLRVFLQGEMAEQKADGILPDWVDPEAMAELILAVGHGIALQTVLGTGGPAADALVEQFARLLLASAQSRQ